METGDDSATACVIIYSLFVNNIIYKLLCFRKKFLVVDSLNYAFFHGELSSSHKQAVITLIERKDKDRRWVKNWRPVSLVNVDVKIGSKAIAKRLENVLPHYSL